MRTKIILQVNPPTLSRAEYQRMLDAGYKFRGAFLYEQAPPADFVYVQLTPQHREPKRIMVRPADIMSRRKD